MCKILEEMRDEYLAKGMAKGETIGAAKQLAEMLSVLGMTEKEYEQLKAAKLQ